MGHHPVCLPRIHCLDGAVGTLHFGQVRWPLALKASGFENPIIQDIDICDVYRYVYYICENIFYLYV